MDVSLPRELEDLVRRLVASGRYRNTAEVVQAGLWLLDAEDRWKSDVRQRIREGVRQMRAGQVVDGEKAGDDVVRGLRRRRGKAEGA
jgi:putative addiction module CopG family antidote